MSATDTVATPADLLAEAGRELGYDVDASPGERPAPSVPQVTIPDPDHVIGNRPCPVCDGIGQVPFDIPQSPRYRACPDCKGTGNVLTGSFDPDCAMILCERCFGKGYVDAATGELPAEVNNPNGVAPFPNMEWDPAKNEWRYQ